jgi:iron complex transport system substrate-binding protein
VIERRNYVLLTLALAAVVLAGCRRDENARERADAPASPQRIVSQTVLSDEILWELGESVRSRVVAVSRMADDRRYSPVADAWPAAVPRVGGTAESVLAVGPDLAIVAGFTAAETKKMLERGGVRLLVLDGFDGFEAYRGTIATIGAAIDAPAEAAALRERFDDEIAAIEARRSPSRPRVISWNDGNIAGKGTTFDDAARTAGFGNLASERGIDGHGRIGIETLVAWDPEYLVIPCGEIACAEAERAFAERPGVARMRAVTEGHVVGVESAILYSAGQTMVELARALQQRKEIEP